MKKNRKNCVLCGNNTKKIFTIDMPVFMGVNINQSEEHFNDMSFNVCETCGEIQIDELLDLNVLYQNNHNINVVGNIWKQHYVELAKFISDTIKDKTILEISDPSAKIAKLSEGYKQWYIIEPNAEKVEVENLEFINGFFDENFNTIKNVDVIIHSHLLEHIHDPSSFFKKCNELLNDDGVMVISVPDMEYILNKEYSPNNILHFEHTYFLNSEILELLGNMNGFKVVETQRYNNHSIFYKLKKDTIVKKPIKLDLAKKFKNNLEKHVSNMDEINQLMLTHNDCNVYLFGAHVSSQFYLFNGLNKDNIKSIIDNDVNKENHKLYGTNLVVNNPTIIKDEKKCVVICSHVGIYYEEIVKQLIELNENVIII
jgi:predicted SAM-dependent methyltransferase